MGNGWVFVFRILLDYRNLLKDVGFNILSVVNNYFFDFFK